MKVILFGQDLDPGPGVTQSFIFNGVNTGSLLNNADKELLITFNKGVNFIADNVYKLSVDNGTKIKIDLQDQRKNAVSGRIDLSVWGQNVKILLPRFENNEVYFNAESEKVSQLIAGNFFDLAFTGIYINISLGTFIETKILKAFSPNFISNELSLYTAPVDVLVGDAINDVSIYHEQKLSIRSLILSKEKASIKMLSLNGHLLLHPDTLTLFDQNTNEKNEEAIFIQYQFALVNGGLSLDFAAGGAQALYWDSYPRSADKASILLLKYGDENAVPPALVPTTGSERISIVYRDGNSNLLYGDDLPNNQFEKTIQGISIGEVSGELKSIAFGSVNFEKREQQLYGLNWKSTTQQEILDQPFWLSTNNDGQKVVKLETAAPATITGLAKGAWLTNLAPEQKANVSLKMDPVPLAGNPYPNIYHIHSLALGTEAWELNSAYEEKESLKFGEKSMIATIQPRSFTASATPSIAAGAATFEIPGTDYHFGATNIYHPKIFGATAITTQTKISEKVIQKIEGINTVFRNFQFLPQSQEHISKFHRIYKNAGSNPERPAGLLSTLPIVTKTPSQFERVPLQLQTPQVNALDPLQPSTQADEWPLRFIHGQKTSSHPLAETDPLTTTISAVVGQKITELQRIWNEGAFLLEDNTDAGLKRIAEAVRTIRHYLDGVSTAEQATRVAFGNEFYRLKLKAIAKTDEQKRVLLRQAKTYIQGNLNALPGFGQRLRDLQNWLTRLKLNESEDKWDLGLFETNWDEGLARLGQAGMEQKLLNALFDHMYKPADRELIANLLELTKEISALPPELDHVKKAVKIFEERFGGIFEREQFPDALRSVVTEAFQGIDPYLAQLTAIWEENGLIECPEISVAQIKARYGERFDVQTYKRIISDNSPTIVNCLEKSLRAKLRDEFKTLINSKIDAILRTPGNYQDQMLATYEEDIIAFFVLVEKILVVLKAEQALVNSLKGINSPEELKQALKGLTPQLRKTAYDTIRDYLLTQYSKKIEEIGVITDGKINELVNNYYDEIGVILKLIDEYNEWKDKIIPAYVKLFDRATASIKTLIQTITRKDVLLNLLKEYLIQKHAFGISLSDLRVDPPQYIVYSKQVSFNIAPGIVDKFNSIVSKLHLDSYKLCDLGWDLMLGDRSVYILKLGNDMTAEDILNDINTRNKKPGADVGPLGDVNAINNYLHKEIKQRNWRGLIILDPAADILKHKLVADLAGKSHIKMKYAAIGGAENSNQDMGLDVYARVLEENDVAENPNDTNKSDAKFTLVKFDASIKNTQLESGDITFLLNFKDLFGKTGNFDKIIIKGIVPKKPDANGSRDFKFTAQLERPTEFKIETAFLDKLVIRGITAERKNNRSVLEVDGTLSFRDFFGGNNIKTIPGQNLVSLKNFRLIVPEQSAGSSTRMGIPRGIDIEIGAIEFVFSQPRPINFGFMEILPQGISYYKTFSTTEHAAFTAGKIFIGKQADELPFDEGFTCLNVKLDLGKLTAMGGSGVGSLEMTGSLGFTLKGGAKGPFFALNSVNGKEITIDIFRFITLYIKELTIATAKLTATQENITYIKAEDAQLKLLGWSPLGDDGQFSILHVQKETIGNETQKSPVTGFVALANKKNDADHQEQGWEIGALKIFWVFIARNLKFGNDQLINLLTDPGGADPEEDSLLNKLEIFDSNKNIKNLSFTPDASWLFGASFSVANFLERCTIILHDQHFYGIMLFSKERWFKEVFGEQKLALAYMPGPTKEQDRFRIEFGLPALNFLGRLQSGLVALEYALNRDFLIDFGFPWRTGNSYLWPRTFALRSGIYETRFGFYFQKKTQIIQEPRSTAVEKYLTIGAGIGIYYGYYVGFRNRFAWAEAGIGITVILAGEVTFKTGNALIPDMNSSIERVEVIGVIGIYAYAEGGIDYWIFSASIRAQVVAALQGRLIYMPKGNSSLTFDATLSVKYKASASIKLGFVRKTFKISGKLDYGVSGRVALN